MPDEVGVRSIQAGRLFKYSNKYSFHLIFIELKTMLLLYVYNAVRTDSLGNGVCYATLKTIW